jgi:hypothetical protein
LVSLLNSNLALYLRLTVQRVLRLPMPLETQHAEFSEAIRLAKSYDHHNDNFDRDEIGYLDRWLCENIELDEGMRGPKKDKRTEHDMLKMLRGIEPINMKGVEAYIKWKAAKEAFDDQDNDKDEIPFATEMIELRFSSKSRFETTRDFLSGLRAQAKEVGQRVTEPALWASTALSTDFSRRFTDWTEWVSQSAPDVYDKARDSIYNAINEGGSELHRLIDRQHGIFDSWGVVKDALPNDSTIDEIGGYFSSLWKDMATPQGVPLVSISRDNYDALADAVTQTLGVPRSWVSDALTVNGAELFASSFGVIALALNWNKADKEKFGEIAATIGMAAAFSANPLMGLVSLVSLARAFQQGRSKQAYTEVLNGMAKGGIGTGIFIGVSSVVGGPTWVGLLVGLCLAVFARNHLDKKIDIRDLVEWISGTIAAARYERGMPSPQM